MHLCLASLHPRILSGQIDNLAGLGRALTRRGHDVALVAPFDTSTLLNASLADLDTGPRRLIPAARAMLAALPRIVRAAHGRDLVHLALPTPAFGWIADLVQAGTGVPTVVGFEGHLVGLGELAAAGRRGALSGYLPLWAINNRLLGRLSLHLCPAYVVSSGFQRQELVGLGVPAERIVVLPNVVEDGKLAASAATAARLRLGLPGRAPLVGYVGHFNDVKGVDVLAAAFQALAAREPSARLALAWSGQGDPAPVRAALGGLDGRVSWLQKVHVGAFLSAVDVLALPYRSTAGQGLFPSLVLEALQAGRPLVTSDLPLLREITSLGPVALVAPPERADLLADRLGLLLGSEQRRREMSEAQRSLARAHFAPDTLVRRYEGLYAAVLGDRDGVALAA